MQFIINYENDFSVIDIIDVRVFCTVISASKKNNICIVKKQQKRDIGNNNTGNYDIPDIYDVK
jgi:hypothetical protein